MLLSKIRCFRSGVRRLFGFCPVNVRHLFGSCSGDRRALYVSGVIRCLSSTLSAVSRSTHNVIARLDDPASTTEEQRVLRGRPITPANVARLRQIARFNFDAFWRLHPPLTPEPDTTVTRIPNERQPIAGVGNRGRPTPQSRMPIVALDGHVAATADWTSSVTPPVFVSVSHAAHSTSRRLRRPAQDTPPEGVRLAPRTLTLSR